MTMLGSNLLIGISVIFLAFIVGYIVDWVLRRVTNSYRCPEFIDATKWKYIVGEVDQFAGGGPMAGKLLGSLERILFVAAIWHNALLLIPGWMAVKVATKWQVWSRILQKITPREENSDLHTQLQRYVGWRVSQRFLLGNILNILLAGLIYFAVAVFLADKSPQSSGFSGWR